MPPKSRKRSSEAEDCESDGGFVANDDDVKDRPKAKKVKSTKSSGMRKDFKLAKKEVVGGGSVDANGDEFWELSHLRRITISEFKGKRMVNVREYYEKDGEALPGKKGMSMPVEQYAALVRLLPHIETVLKQKGEKVPRPEYEGQSTAEETNEVDKDDEDEEDEEGGLSADNGVEKKNFEATSEEDGD